MTTKIISDIRAELKKHIDEPYRDGAIRFFKEPIKCWGVRTPIVRKIARQYYQEVKDLDKLEIFELAEELLKSNKNEEGTIAFDWISRRKNEFKISDFKFFDKIVKTYLTNWAMVDDFCTHVVHEMIEQYPSLIPKVKAWHKSKNRWVRRASAVSFITTQGSFYVTKVNIRHIFDVSRALLTDSDDLVQKGYGWMLKAAADGNEKAVFDFVMKNKHKMPRTALRYAIEKMPKDKKKQAMK